MTQPFKVICTISLAFDTPSYQSAGEKLDQIDRKLTKILDGTGHHEITGFQTRPCKAVQFERRLDEQMAQPMTNDSREAMSMPEPEIREIPGTIIRDRW